MSEEKPRPSWADRPWERAQPDEEEAAKPSTFETWTRGPKAWAAAVGTALVVFGGGAWAFSSAVDSAPAAPSKYTQTWSTSYAQTTCADWSGRMTSQQRFAASADMLMGARNNDGASELPADSMVNEFASGITTACVVPTMAITDAAIGLYLTERTRFGP